MTAQKPAASTALDDALYLTWLKAQGYEELRPHPGKPGRWVGLFRFMFTWAILEGDMHDYFGFADRWCYHDREAAAAALAAWGGTGEPTGWHRHPGTGRRRDPETGREWVAE